MTIKSESESFRHNDDVPRSITLSTSGKVTELTAELLAMMIFILPCRAGSKALLWSSKGISECMQHLEGDGMIG